MRDFKYCRGWRSVGVALRGIMVIYSTFSGQHRGLQLEVVKLYNEGVV